MYFWRNLQQDNKRLLTGTNELILFCSNITLILMDRLGEVQKAPKIKMIIPSSSLGNFQSLEDHKPAPVYSYRKNSNDSQPKSPIVNHFQTKDCSQTSKSEHFQGAIDEVKSESKSSAFAMGNLLQQKARQVKELCLRLEQRESQYLELQKKMLDMMQENPKVTYTNQLFNMSEQIIKRPSKLISMKSDSEASTPANNTIYNIKPIDISQGPQPQDNDFRTTKRLTRQKYLQSMAQTPYMGRAPLQLFPQDTEQLEGIPLDFLPKISSDNCLFEQIIDSNEEDNQTDESDHIEQPQHQLMLTPKFNTPPLKSLAHNQDITFRENTDSPNKIQKPLKLSSALLSLRVENFALSQIQQRLDQCSIQDFKRGLTMFFSPKGSAINSKQLTPRQRKVLSLNSNIIDYRIQEHSDLSICKFKRLVKMQIESLNLIWKLQHKINRKEHNEISGQILKGLRNDLIGFVDDFNKKYKVLKQTGIGVAIFEEQTISRVTQILQLAKGFPQ